MAATFVVENRAEDRARGGLCKRKGTGRSVGRQ